MAKIADLKMQYRLFLAAYRFRRLDWRPGARLPAPLPECRLAAVTTAALHLPQQPPFDPKIKGGDVSFRIIPAEADLGELQMSHRSRAFDHRGAREDPNLVFPLERLKELVREGEIGSLSPRHYSFMGSITAPGRLLRDSAPRLLAELQKDRVQGVFFTPV